MELVLLVLPELQVRLGQVVHLEPLVRLEQREQLERLALLEQLG